MTILVDNARAELQRFIAECFRTAYGAKVSYFCAHLLGMRDGGGVWQAAAGYTPAAYGAVYLEHYLDQPVEVVLSRRLGTDVPRHRIAEVGNLVSAAKGCGRRFLPALYSHLRDLDYGWVVFTATREVRDILEQLSFDALALAPAAASRLPDGGAGWGTYYAHDPNVMAGCIG